jgi:hypothetical protein
VALAAGAIAAGYRRVATTAIRPETANSSARLIGTMKCA